MAKKAFLKDHDDIEILPITRGELVLDSSGKVALHSNEFLASNSRPGLMSAEDKAALSSLAGGTIDSDLSTTSTNPVQNKVVTNAINSIKTSYLKSATVSTNTLTIVDQSNTETKFYNTTYGVVTQAADGLAPKLGTDASATIGTQADEWVLTSTKGSAPTWRKLPVNAFKNDNNNTTYTFTSGNGGFTVTPSGGTAQTVSIGKPATAGTADKLVCEAASTNSFRHVWFSYDGEDGRLVYDNDFTYNPATNVLNVGSITGSVAWGNITGRPDSFTPSAHNHTTEQITSLSNYAKATSASDLAATDTLNTALGKLEYKTDVAYNLVKGAYDGDGTIENLAEILKVLEGISDTETIQAIVGKYLPLTGGTIKGVVVISGNEATNVPLNIATPSMGNTGYIRFGAGISIDELGHLGFSAKGEPAMMYKGTVNSLIHSGNANKADVPWTASNILFPTGTSATWNIHSTNAYKGITVLNAVQAKPEGAPDHYAVGLSVSGYYGFTLASLGGGDVLLYRRKNDSDWKTIAFTDSNITGNASSASKLEDNTAYSAWGQTFFQNGKPKNVTGHLNLGLAELQVSDSSASYEIGRLYTAYGLYIGAGTADKYNTLLWGQNINLVTGTNGQTRLYIKNDGNVGIGTTSPSTKLEVAGDVLSKGYYLKEASTVTPQNMFGWYIWSNTVQFTKRDTNNTYIKELLGINLTTEVTTVTGTFKVSGNSSVTGDLTAAKLIKSGSSDAYVLLGAGGHKAISDFMLKSDELTNNLTTIIKTLTVSKDWIDTGIIINSATFPDGDGSYIVQLVRGNNNYIFTGVATLLPSQAGNISVYDSDEILLHGGGWDMTGQYYLRTVHDTTNKVVKIQIAYTCTDTRSFTYTFKFKKLI